MGIYTPYLSFLSHLALPLNSNLALTETTAGVSHVSQRLSLHCKTEQAELVSTLPLIIRCLDTHMSLQKRASSCTQSQAVTEELQPVR